MWIRSQNKHDLIKADRIHQDGGHIWSDGYITLGKYSTKEKALKVLDMIQKRIEPYRLVMCNNGFIPIKSTGEVFQMPQEDEV